MKIKEIKKKEKKMERGKREQVGQKGGANLAFVNMREPIWNFGLKPSEGASTMAPTITW